MPITCKCLELQVLRGTLVRAHLEKSELFETENRYWMGRMYYSTAQVEKTIIGTDMLNELHCLLNLGDSTHLQILSDNNSTVIPLDYAPNSMMLPFPGALEVWAVNKLDCGLHDVPSVVITNNPPPPTQPYPIKPEALEPIRETIKKLKNSGIIVETQSFSQLRRVIRRGA